MTEYVDLHCHSCFSLLDSWGIPKQVVERAKELGRKSIALTDHGSISGWVQLDKACKDAGIKPIFGYEAYMVESIDKMFEGKLRKKNHLTLLAKNNTGYRNILKLASEAYNNFYYFPTLDFDLLAKHSDGVICLSGCWSGMLQRLLADGKEEEAEALINKFQTIYGDNFYLETQPYAFFLQTFDKLMNLSRKTSVPIVLTCDNHFLTDGQGAVQEMLHAIRDRRVFDEKQIICDAYQWEADKLLALMNKCYPYGNWNKIFGTVNDVANSCNAELEKGNFPTFISDTGEKSRDVMLRKCKDGIKRLGLEGAGQVYKDRMRKEFQLIESKGFIDYILIAADFIEWAKSHGVLIGSGRGSSAGSLICYLLGITMLDPIKYDLLFERFIDETRTDPPDIDTDFDADRRDLVKEYAKQKYGEENVCDVATFAKFKGKNSLDEVGKMYQIPKGEVEFVKSYLIERTGADARAEFTIEDTFATVPEAEKVAVKYPDILKACLLEGQLRHLGTHAAGVLISTKPLDEVVALYKREDRVVASFEMKDAARLNLIKIDFLGLTELTVLREVYEMMGKDMRDIYGIPLDDATTLEAFKNVDVQGIFQFEGDSTRSILRQMPKVDFEQLIACITLSKPGPSRSGSTAKYIAKMRGKEKVETFDWHPILADITSKTFGQMIYQEQIIRILREFANFSAADANTCRAVVAKSKGEQEFDKYYSKFEEGVSDKIDSTKAQHLWDSMKSFGRYAFNRSHAASYALLGYWSMYMKVHYPIEFYICKLNHETEDAKKIRLLSDAAKKGFEILPPVLGKSGVFWAKEGDKQLRAGLTDIKNIGEKTAILMVENKYSCREDFETNKVKGVNLRAYKALDGQKCFKNDVPAADFFKVHDYDVLDVLAPNRTKSENIRDWDDAYNLTIAGRFIEMNYKDVFEVKKSKGQRTDDILNPEKSKYVTLLLEDETDRTFVLVNRFLFAKIGEIVRDAFDNNKFVIVEGIKTKGSKMVRAKRVVSFEEEDIKELIERKVK